MLTFVLWKRISGTWRKYPYITYNKHISMIDDLLAFYLAEQAVCLIAATLLLPLLISSIKMSLPDWNYWWQKFGLHTCRNNGKTDTENHFKETKGLFNFYSLNWPSNCSLSLSYNWEMISLGKTSSGIKIRS